ncbi:MAG: CcmD family protein [Chloroflexi bacterium]|nr:CcmD family protein [Chloroflexota bacterium]
MRNRIFIAFVFSLVVLALTAPAALAAPAAQDAPGESNLGYLLAGTLLTWAGFFAYAIYLARKNRDLRREVEDLRRLLGERE